jgi:peptide deformylase
MKIVRYPHPALRFPSKPLTMIDQKVRLYAGGMLELMYEAKGLGLAANQVALPYQLLVMNATADPAQKEHERILINPVILDHGGGKVEGEEGCLSFPGLFQKVRRWRTVRVQAYDLEGKQVEVVPAEVLESRVLQHEIDHLHGELFIDKMGPLGKLASRGSLHQLEREYRKAQERDEIPPDAKIEEELSALAALA